MTFSTKENKCINIFLSQRPTYGKFLKNVLLGDLSQVVDLNECPWTYQGSSSTLTSRLAGRSGTNTSSSSDPQPSTSSLQPLPLEPRTLRLQPLYFDMPSLRNAPYLSSPEGFLLEGDEVSDTVRTCKDGIWNPESKDPSYSLRQSALNW